MRILLSPCVNELETILYTFDGEIITATIGEVSDVFDFTGFPEGELDVTAIESVLPHRVVNKAVRENGVLSVTLLNFIKEDASEEEKFPEWKVI